MLSDLDFRGFFAEFIGTFLLAFSISMSGGEPLAVGGSLWLGMMITIFRSGAQFNPAVTLAVMTKQLVTGDYTAMQLVTFALNIPCQVAGALLAGFMAWGVGHETFYFDIESDFKLSQAFFSELLFTMLLCLNVLQAGKARDGLLLEGGMIALTLTTCAYTVGHVTKNCLNPAVEIGLDTAHWADRRRSKSALWLYIIAPLLGGLAAATVNRLRAKVNKHDFRTSLELNLVLNH
jgi:aquaporin Z